MYNIVLVTIPKVMKSMNNITILCYEIMVVFLTKVDFP